MRIHRAFTALALAAGALTALPAAAQFAKPEDAVKYRKGAYQVMAAHFGRIGAMVNGRVPFDAAAAQANADIVVVMSRLPFTAFMEGTASSEKGGPKASVWTERAKFDEGAKKMQDEVVKLQAAARTGSMDNLRSAFGAAAGTCKACHDDYRN
ncbi:MAG: cytochrome c [Rubrivivax sp.]|nr:cytochrome c [Rubrivivax sp.]